MPRKEAKLVPFLENALKCSKYKNLIYEDRQRKVFCLYLPHKTSSLSMDYQYLFKDWYAENGNEYVFFKYYTCARQAMRASLKNSDYVEPICLSHNKVKCRILSQEEVKEKKRQKKETKKLKNNQEDKELDYESLMKSVKNFPDCQNDKNVLLSVEHDHAYNSLGKKSVEDAYDNENNYKVKSVNMVDKSLPYGQESLKLESYLENDCLNENFHNISQFNDNFNNCLGSLDEIPYENLFSMQGFNTNYIKEGMKRNANFLEKYELLGNTLVLQASSDGCQHS